jgi:hypothetical protein
VQQGVDEGVGGRDGECLSVDEMGCGRLMWVEVDRGDESMLNSMVTQNYQGRAREDVDVVLDDER